MFVCSKIQGEAKKYPSFRYYDITNVICHKIGMLIYPQTVVK